jgi:hypothetical protein
MRHVFIAILLVLALSSVGTVACNPGGGGNPAPSGGPGY